VINFFSNFLSEPSSKLNHEKFVRFLLIEAIERIESINSNKIIVMGYDLNSLEKIRLRRPNAKILVCDPRQEHYKKFKFADGIITNGLEMANYYYGTGLPIFISHIVPSAAQFTRTPKLRQLEKQGNFLYHGNVIHARSLFEGLNKYSNDLTSHGCHVTFVFNNDDPLLARKIQNTDFASFIPWSSSIYSRLSELCDFGIANSQIPIQRTSLVRKISSSISSKYNETKVDYMVRFKPTSNPGRALSFIKQGIPCLVDFTPSNTQAVMHAHNGFVFSNFKNLVHQMLYCSKMNEQEYEKLSMNATNHYKRFFDDEMEVEQIRKFMEA
jgi:hypothetical protein